MQASVYKSLGAINRVNPEADLLSLQLPRKLRLLGQGGGFLLAAKLQQLQLIGFFELHAGQRGKIFLCDDGDGVCVLVLDAGEDVGLQEEVKLIGKVITSVTGLFSPFQQRVGQEEKAWRISQDSHKRLSNKRESSSRSTRD